MSAVGDVLPYVVGTDYRLWILTG